MFKDNFGNFINPTAKEIRSIIAKGEKIKVGHQIRKEEIIQKDFAPIDFLMNTATQVGKGMIGSLMIGCTGYDDVPDELYDIPEVKDYVREIFKKYPHIPYYLSREDNPNAWLFACCGTTIKMGENNLSPNELIKKYGSYDKIPPQPFAIKLSDDFLYPLLKATIAHGRKNKDAQRAKFVACDYAFNYKNPELIIDLKITEEELREFGFIK